MKLLQHIKTSKFYIIQVDQSHPEGVSANCSVFRMHGEEVDLDKELDAMDLSKLISGIPKFSAVILIFLCDQVLTRFSSVCRATLFEEIEGDEFYFQKDPSSQEWMVHSACRKTMIDAILQRLVLEKLFILDVSIGPGSLIALEDLIQNERLEAGHFQFKFNNGLIDEIREINSMQGNQHGRIEEDRNGEVELEGTSISSKKLLKLAALLHFIKEGPAILSLLKTQNTQYSFFYKFRKTAIGTLGAMFILLLTNFLLFSGVRNELGLLKSSGENQIATVGQIKQLQSQIKEYRKLAIFQKSALEETYSFYLEEIARKRVSGVWFNSLELYPSLKKPEKNKVIEFDRSVILLNGEVNDPVSLNAFIGSLKKSMWVEDIELLYYENSEEKANADFELRIKKK